MTKLPIPYHLQKATSADGPAVLSLLITILAEYGLQPDSTGTDADLGDITATYWNRRGAFWLILDGADNNVLAGSLGLYPMDEPDVCELRKMHLLKPHRGRALMDITLAKARRLGYRRMTLETATILKEAIALYTSYGFQPVKSDHLSSRCDRQYARDLWV